MRIALAQCHLKFGFDFAAVKKKVQADCDAGFHRMITTAIARVARKRGATIQYKPLRKADYCGPDDQKTRTAYAESLSGTVGKPIQR